MRHQNEGKVDHCHHLKDTSLGSARLIVISGCGDTARSLRTADHDHDHDIDDGHDDYYLLVCTAWGLPGDCLGLGGAGGIFWPPEDPAVPIFRAAGWVEFVFGWPSVPEPILGVPGVTVPIFGVPAPEVLLEEGLVAVRLMPGPAGGRFEGLEGLGLVGLGWLEGLGLWAGLR